MAIVGENEFKLRDLDAKIDDMASSTGSMHSKASKGIMKSRAGSM